MFIRFISTIMVLLMGVALIAQEEKGGQTSPDATNRWTVTLAPYLLFPNMNGNVTIRGNPAEVDLGTGDIFRRLDFGAMLYVETSNPTWAIAVDGLYMNLGEKGQTPVTGRQVEVDMKQLAVEVVGMRRVSDWAEVGVGGRLNVIDGGLRIEPGERVLPGRDVSDSKTWFDPLLVARFTAPLESSWRLGIRGDIGGFGIGSKFAWQVYPYGGYRFSRLFELTAALRVISMKYETGADESLFIYDMRIFGPEIGFLFHL
jgi:hypothetical protein